LRIGEVTALKFTSLDFQTKTIDISAALDCATRKQITPKSNRGVAPLPMSSALEKHLCNWIEKKYRPNAETNPEGYIFTNSKGRPYLSDNVVRYGVHRAMGRPGIKAPKGVHIGAHCFRHGVTTSLLESGTPIHIVTRLMRHSDSRVALDHYAHIVSDADRKESEKLSLKIEQNISQLESDSKMESGAARTA
jgi:integrase